MRKWASPRIQWRRHKNDFYFSAKIRYEVVNALKLIGQVPRLLKWHLPGTISPPIIHGSLAAIASENIKEKRNISLLLQKVKSIYSRSEWWEFKIWSPLYQGFSDVCPKMIPKFCERGIYHEIQSSDRYAGSCKLCTKSPSTVTGFILLSNCPQSGFKPIGILIDLLSSFFGSKILHRYIHG